jgi:hypothetical protein
MVTRDFARPRSSPPAARRLGSSGRRRVATAAPCNRTERPHSLRSIVAAGGRSKCCVALVGGRGSWRPPEWSWPLVSRLSPTPEDAKAELGRLPSNGGRNRSRAGRFSVIPGCRCPTHGMWVATSKRSSVPKDGASTRSTHAADGSVLVATRAGGKARCRGAITRRVPDSVRRRAARTAPSWRGGAGMEGLGSKGRCPTSTPR